MDESFENITPDNLVLNHQDIPVYEPIVVAPLLENLCSFNNNEPRLMIHQIVNENFKSYAGTKVLGPFHKNFNAIVGPNGSGKSNVIDSMLFVFGFRASKIRSKNISVLIHSSDNIQNIQSCSVSVHFQKIIDNGPDTYQVVNGSNFVVSRTAFKDNSSYYRLNDKKVMYNEVAAILRQSGIDLDRNRFLILQGEVEQIAMMKPKAPSENEDGMLEFLEDIIGSNRFKKPLETLKKREDELTEMRTEQLNRVKAVEKEKDSLEGPKNEAIEYLKAENKIIKNKNKIFQRTIYDSQVKEKEARNISNEIEVILKNCENRMTEISEEKKSKVAANKKTIKRYNELSIEEEAKFEKFRKLEQQDVGIRENLKHAQEQIKKLNKHLEEETKKLEDLKLMPESQQKIVDKLTKELNKLQASQVKEEESLKTVMDSFKAETADLQKEKEKKENEVLVLQKSVTAVQMKYSESQLELDLFNNNLTKETKKLEDLRDNINRLQATLTEKTRMVEEIEKKLPETSSAHEKSKKDLNEVNQSELKLSEQTRQVRTKLEDARSHMHASQGQGRVVEYVMNLKRSGQVAGIYGRLGDLGAIDEKYDVAISTACGSLDYIVVETMDVAQSVVKLLKANNVGLATFIGLDKMRRWQENCNRKINTPENVSRLFDLIKVKEEVVLPAFYFALRDTLVAKNLDQATRIAYGAVRYRVVTLEGQLIDTSGTMSGGGNRAMKGKMGSSLAVDFDPKVIEQLERELENSKKNSNAFRENRSKLEEMVEKFGKSKQDMTHQLKMLEREIKTIEEQLTQLQKQEQGQVKKVKDACPDQTKLKQLEKISNSHKKDYEEINKTFTQLQDDIQEIKRQIMEIGGDEMKIINTRISGLQSQIQQINTNLTKAVVAIKSAERNSKKCAEKIETMTSELKKQTANQEQFKKEMSDIDTDATKVLEESGKIKVLIEQVGKEMKDVSEVIARLDEEELKIKKEKLEISHKYEKAVADQKMYEDSIKQWTKELNKLSLNKIMDTDEMETLVKWSEEELLKMDMQALKLSNSETEAIISKSKPNMAAIAEFKKKEELYLQRVERLTAITVLRTDQRNQFEDLRRRRIEEFMQGFNTITCKLKEMYQMITLGGDAEFEIVDSMDPFSEGIVFSVRPPKKSWKNISNLSGGEKTLSSLALVFALHHYKPTPLYVMDEIDAALDFRNVSIVANYIKERTKNAQFIIISLRNNMFELCDHLIGIYKTHNCTQSIAIDPNYHLKQKCIPVEQ